MVMACVVMTNVVMAHIVMADRREAMPRTNDVPDDQAVVEQTYK